MEMRLLRDQDATTSCMQLPADSLLGIMLSSNRWGVWGGGGGAYGAPPLAVVPGSVSFHASSPRKGNQVRLQPGLGARRAHHNSSVMEDFLVSPRGIDIIAHSPATCGVQSRLVSCKTPTPRRRFYMMCRGFHAFHSQLLHE